VTGLGFGVQRSGFEVQLYVQRIGTIRPNAKVEGWRSENCSL
jgi:hypothetical protein